MNDSIRDLLRHPYGWMVAGLLGVAASAAIRIGFVQHLRIDELALDFGPTLLYGAVFGGGIALLCVGQANLLHQVAHDRTAEPLQWRGPLLAALALHLLAALAMPLTSNDIFSNVHYGHLEVFEGANPYTASGDRLLYGAYQPWVGDRWRTAVCVYGPTLLWLSDLAAWVGGRGNVLGAVLAYKAILLLVGSGMVWLGWVHARTLRGRGEQLFVFWFLAANPLWLIEVSGQAHNDGVMVLLMTAAVVVYKRGMWLLCAVLLGLATGAKYMAAVPLGFLLLWELWIPDRPLHRRLGRVATQSLVAIAAIVLPYGVVWRGPAILLRPLGDLTALRLAYSYLRLLYYSFYLQGPRFMYKAYQLGSRLLWILVGGLTIRWIIGWWRKPGDEDLPWATALRFLLLHTLLLNSHFLPWYLTWFLPLLLCEPDRQWWVLILIYGFFALFHYALDWAVDVIIAEEIINTLWMHLPPLIMLVRMARRRPALFGEKRVALLKRLGELSRRRGAEAENS